VVEAAVYGDVAAQDGGDGIYHGLFNVADDSGGLHTYPPLPSARFCRSSAVYLTVKRKHRMLPTPRVTPG